MLAASALESPVGFQRWCEGAGVHGEARSVVEVEAVDAFVEEDNALLLGGVEEPAGIAKVTVLPCHFPGGDRKQPVGLGDLSLKHWCVEGEVVVSRDDELQGCVDGPQEGECGVKFVHLGAVRDVTAVDGHVHWQVGELRVFAVGVGEDQKTGLDFGHFVCSLPVVWRSYASKTERLREGVPRTMPLSLVWWVL